MLFLCLPWSIRVNDCLYVFWLSWLECPCVSVLPLSPLLLLFLSRLHVWVFACALFLSPVLLCFFCCSSLCWLFWSLVLLWRLLPLSCPPYWLPLVTCRGLVGPPCWPLPPGIWLLIVTARVSDPLVRSEVSVCSSPHFVSWQQRLRPCVGLRPLHHVTSVVDVPGATLLSWSPSW